MLSQRLAGLWQRVPFYFVLTATLLLFGQLCLFVWKNAVNVLFADGWDFYTPLFQGESWWTSFLWQFGPHRMGLGAIVAHLVAGYSSWNSRVDGLVVVVVIFLATLAALALKKKLFGRWSVFDVVIPSLLLSRSFFEIYLSIPHVTVSALPVLLVMLYCLGWIQRRRTVRYAWILVVNFCAIYTGYALLLGLLTPILFARELWLLKSSPDRRARNWALAALVISIASMLSFFVGYQFQPRGEFNLAQYFWFVALMFGNFFGLKAVNDVTILVGLAAFMTLGAVLIWHTIRLTNARYPDADKSLVIAILLGFSVLFAAGAAAGRSEMSAEIAQASRYLPYVACATVGLYFHLLIAPTPNLRRWLVPAYALLMIIVSLQFNRVDRDTIYWLREGKRQWKQCYLRSENVHQCNREAGFAIHPHPESTRLQTKLDYLKRHRVNLYSSSQE